jgi:hypothetical protein
MASGNNNLVYATAVEVHLVHDPSTSLPFAVNVEHHKAKNNHESPLFSITPSIPTISFNERKIKDFLTVRSWSSGLQESFIKNLSKSAFRYFICDDSGSMSTSDGHNVIDTTVGKRHVL